MIPKKHGIRLISVARGAIRHGIVRYVWAVALACGICCISGCVTLGGPDFNEQVAKAVAAQRALMEQYVKAKKFGETLPRLSGAALEKYMDDSFSAVQKAQMTDMVAKEFDRCRIELVYPKWVEFKNANIKDKVDALVKEALVFAASNEFIKSRASFEAAREIAWTESVSAVLDGNLVPEVNRLVFATSMELLDTNVNILQWPHIERELRSIVEESVETAKLEYGVKRLKEIEHVRTYTKRLDDRVAALTAELVRLGVKKPATDVLAHSMHRFMCEAANLADAADTSETKTIPAQKQVPIDESIYQRLLAEFKAALLLHNCTEVNTERCISWFAKQGAKLIADIERPALAPERKEKHIVRLGATAINKRMDALRDNLVKELESVIAKNSSVVKEVEDILSSGDPLAARLRLIAIISGKNSTPAQRAFARDLLLTKVNVAIWEKIKKEIMEKTDEFADSGKCVEGVSWIAAYPPVRTYAEEIDEAFAAVRKKAVDLGVDESKADEVVAQVVAIAAEAENLADYEDSSNTVVGPKVTLNCAEFEQKVAVCRETLVRNGCTVANADKIIAELRSGLAGEFARIGAGPSKVVVRLGANAINVRLRKLKIECAGVLVVRCVSALSAKGDFVAAREIVRDVALTGDDEFDAKTYAVRLGVLNTLVNPAQLEHLSGEVAAKIESFWKSGDFRAMKKWIAQYPYVHDDYPEIAKSYNALSSAMLGLSIKEKDVTEYMGELSSRVQGLIEKAKGAYVANSTPDISELQKALAEFEKTFLAQYFDKMVSMTVRKRIHDEILVLLEKSKPVPISTWELNEKLRAFIAKAVKRLAGVGNEMDIDNLLVDLVSKQEYLELVAAMDAEFSYDAQIAMAEDAIAKQLGGADSEAHLNVNAVMGDYARAMRLLKLRKDLSPDLLAAVMFGAVYLDQPTVLKHAKSLSAAVDATSSRDPLARTPLLLAVQTGRTGLIQKLVADGADAGVVDAVGDTAVHYAVRQGNISVLKAMLKKNDVNAKNRKGETALFDAARKNQVALVDELIKAGVDVLITNAESLSSFDEACRCGSRDVLDSLAKAGASYGPVQLAIAARNDRISIAQWLVSMGVDVNGEGVMAAAGELKKNAATLRYLIHEGGVVGLPVENKKDTAEPSGNGKVEKSGTL